MVEGGRGAGKTTLLEVAAAWRRPDSGEVWLGGHDVVGLQLQSLPFVRRNIGFVEAVPRLLSGISVLDNVMLPLGARGEPIAFAREAALRALGKVGGMGLAASDVTTLSGAACRLVAVARAIAAAPPLLLLDEPSGSLSPPDIGALLSVLMGAAEHGAAVICASADASFVSAAAAAGARRYRLDNGRLSSTSGPLGLVGARRSGVLALNEAIP